MAAPVLLVGRLLQTPNAQTSEFLLCCNLCCGLCLWKSTPPPAPASGLSACGLSACGLSTSRFEAERFGHEKGAFTGAERRGEGLVAAAGGTQLLDELGEIPPELQVKLLRLRKRRDDIALLARAFLQSIAPTLRFDGDALQRLRKLVEGAALLCDGGLVGVRHLAAELGGREDPAGGPPPGGPLALGRRTAAPRGGGGPLPHLGCNPGRGPRNARPGRGPERAHALPQAGKNAQRGLIRSGAEDRPGVRPILHRAGAASRCGPRRSRHRGPGAPRGPR